MTSVEPLLLGGRRTQRASWPQRSPWLGLNPLPCLLVLWAKKKLRFTQSEGQTPPSKPDQDAC